MQIDRHIITDDAPLITAISRLNDLSGAVMTLIVTDRDGRMAGTLTDGDVRRALLQGVTLDAPVADAMFRNFRFLREGEVNPDTLRKLRRHRLSLIPVLDSDGKLCRLIDTRVTKTVLPVSAILMAGGKGERLRPLTLTTPKPLLEIGGKAIIDYNIEALASVGIENVNVTVNYLAEQLEEHFSQPVAGINVKCVRENRPLGTIGAASLVDIPAEGETIVMNSDLLTTISFEDLYLHHRNEKADITIAAVPYNISVPYAILDIFSNDLLRSLSSNERTDATDLIERALTEGRTVSYFPINGTWIDVGTPVDFAHARELMRHLQQTLEA